MQPLEECGILICRTDQELLEALDLFVVVEREGQIIACAALFPFFKEKCGEVAAISVSPDCRGQGQGAKLLGILYFAYQTIKEDTLQSQTTKNLPGEASVNI
ncbi:hypothetical protein F2P56_013793 [Juglans regia]|uniref:N-acetyltransferase domain-containing protein n=1 Tax=Juglans regia TaxID=51240 RepID=A0A834CSA4_JUGRE|nr:hypothetical protein F2P56_013793 [Juglans regia]